MAYIRCSGNIGGSLKVRTASGNPCTFSTDLADALVSLTANIVCGGGGGTPSTPIPIVGHSELNLVRCGSNLVDFNLEPYGDADVFWLPQGNYYCSLERASGLSTAWYFGAVKTDGTYCSKSELGLDDWNVAGGGYCYGNADKDYFAFTIPAGVSTIKIGRLNADNTIGVMINVGSTATAYEHYNGTPFTVAFGQTVYGGVYDKSGRLTIETDTKITLDGTENWTLRELGANSATFMVNGFKNNVKNELNQICSHFTFNGDAYLLEHINTFVQGESGNLFIQVDKNIADNANDFKTWLATQYANGTPVEYTYNSTATPIVIDVPSISVFAENGVNNIVSDCGGDVSVSYLELIRGT